MRWRSMACPAPCGNRTGSILPPLDQRTLFEGNSVLRGGQTPRIEPARRSVSDLRIA